MTGSQRTTQRVWATISVVLACLTVAACNRDPKDDWIWTPPAGPTPSTQLATVRGTVLDLSGAPIAGAQVTGTFGIQVTRFTGADGRFDLGSLVGVAQDVRIDVNKAGFVPHTTYGRGTSAGVNVVLRLRPMDALPVDGSITADLLPTDPPDYVGEVYDSDYSSNTRYYGFVNGNDEVVVDLEWDHSVTPTLKMWVKNDTSVSLASDTHEVLRLPPHQAGILLVGSPDGLTNVVRFTLTVK
jgi:hypothetical protein